MVRTHMVALAAAAALMMPLANDAEAKKRKKKRKGEVPTGWVDSDAGAPACYFQPKWDARQGAQQLYDAFRQVGLTEQDVAGGRYRRLGTLQGLLDRGAIDGSLRWTAVASGRA